MGYEQFPEGQQPAEGQEPVGPAPASVPQDPGTETVTVEGESISTTVEAPTQAPDQGDAPEDGQTYSGPDVS